mmetsp:Transcript_22512/g.52125  ORF Transcript_22512/g.52125 Transcript_22512/m.52125 type:complete len:399 (+) Transcript_22512:110-1306(+)|eukprot:CAMPEP_0182573480 /NCGR_PEP_ID=MMETSP1324-20130603/20243_1 /TAXON_ID=236786 /ORGANISM="Florenciella sp., Strain RCC1587" /LENGTH=398 /DNA_ID=CAMNT_0024788599 /DNA_START=90 /DNA_END=1286 /DNA_ORIENTATION=+
MAATVDVQRQEQTVNPQSAPSSTAMSHADPVSAIGTQETPAPVRSGGLAHTRRNISNNSLARLASSGMIIARADLTHNPTAFAEGEFGTIHLGEWRKTVVCVKALKHFKRGRSRKEGKPPAGLEDMLNEICVWSTVRHPSIVTFLGCYLDDPEQPLVVMEYMEGGTLQSHLEEVGRMDTDVVVIQALQIARGLFSLHNHNPKIIHRDLKPSNLLYSNLQKNDLKIADFGLSKMLIEKRGQDHRNMTGGTGSCRYMAPENYWYQEYDHKVDVYSFGMILFYMCSGVTPFIGCRRADLDQIHCNGTRPKQLSSKHPLYPLVVQCWAASPLDRPPFDRVIDMLQAYQQGPPAPPVTEKKRSGFRLFGSSNRSGSGARSGSGERGAVARGVNRAGSSRNHTN